MKKNLPPLPAERAFNISVGFPLSVWPSELGEYANNALRVARRVTHPNRARCVGENTWILSRPESEPPYADQRVPAWSLATKYVDLRCDHMSRKWNSVTDLLPQLLDLQMGTESQTSIRQRHGLTSLLMPSIGLGVTRLAVSSPIGLDLERNSLIVPS